ncbi:MAG: type I glyceraldehyde-3-phosphate dehydrogenase [bacterium]
MIRVAINGFGRIGRIAFRQMITDKEFNIVAINSIGTAEDMAYLVKYDTAQGAFHEDEISYTEDSIVIKDTKKIKVLNELDPTKLPWNEMGIDLVLECTGVFTSKEDLNKHIQAGAKKVILSAPGKDDIKTIVYNVNDNEITPDDNVLSAASCTTNCLAPVLNVIEKQIGIKMGYMTTIHAYTSDQMILDGIHKKGIRARRGRSAAQNIVPASTGAAKAIGLVIPSLLGKMDGTSLRVPTQTGSVIDVTLLLNRETTVEEINRLLESSQNETMKFTLDPIVSSDIIGKKYGAVVDGLSTSVMSTPENQIVKILAWYDNEYGYTAQMLRTGKKCFNK